MRFSDLLKGRQNLISVVKNKAAEGKCELADLKSVVLLIFKQI